MVVAAEIHTTTHFYAWTIAISTATRPLASTSFASTLYQVHCRCRGWRIKSSYWGIMMSSRVKLPTTIDRRRDTRMAFLSLSPNHCYVMWSLNLRYRISVIQTLNKLPDSLIRKMYTHRIYRLTSYAKKYFISNYKTEFTIENCCTCSSMLNAVIISDMSNTIFVIKHPHHSGRNVMLDLCLTVLMGEPGRQLCVGDRRVCQACAFFSATHLLY